MSDAKSNSDSGNGNKNQESNPMPDPEWRGYYGVAGFWIFGEIAIWGLCSKITDDNSTYWLVLITASVSFMIFIAMLVQIEITKLQWKAMQEGLDETRKMAGEMSEQRKIALRQLETTDRPWLKVQIQFTSPLAFTEEGASVSVRFTIINVGHSVAVNATLEPRIHIQAWGDGVIWANVLKAHDELCANVHGILPTVLFPNDPPFIQDYIFSIPQSELEKGRVAGSDLIHPYVMGCVDYQFSGHEAHHQTRFLYEIHRLDASQPNGSLIILIGQDVPPTKLVLQKPVIGASDYAD